jgi:hypothetical protein
MVRYEMGGRLESTCSNFLITPAELDGSMRAQYQDRIPLAVLPGRSQLRTFISKEVYLKVRNRRSF